MSSVHLEDLRDLLKTAPAQRLISFFERQAEWAKSGTPPPLKHGVSQRPIDSSTSLMMVRAVLPHYRDAMLELGIDEADITSYLNRYEGASSIPPIEEVLEAFYGEERVLRPEYKPLDLQAITPEDALFQCYNGLPTPNGLQKAILSHVIENVSVHVKGGHPLKGIIVLATGLGKTYLSIFLLDRFLRSMYSSFNHFLTEENGVVLFVVNSSVIRDQAFVRYKAYFSRLIKPRVDAESLFLKIEPGISNTKLEQTLRTARFVFVLFQSLHILQKYPDAFNRIYYVIVDEVHHIIAPKYCNSISLLSSHPKLRLMVGLTATLVHRNDPTADRIKHIFNNNVFVDLPWTIAKSLQFFPQVEYYECGFGSYQKLIAGLENRTASIQNFLTVIRKSLEHGVTVAGEAVFDDIIRFITRKKCKRSILFFGSITDMESFYSLSQSNEYNSGGCALKDIEFFPVHYQIKKQLLAERFARFCSVPSENDRFVLLTVGMATEGFDLQFIDLVVMLRRTESERIFVQQLGRGLRKYPGKDVVYVLDYVYGLRSRWARCATATADLDSLREDILSFWPVITLAPPSVSFHQELSVSQSSDSIIIMD
ncbi:Helicase-related protein [Giardia duodenalis ATCC 50581]|uniref:Helicase-related protein n=1 Tax=Giardia intestinalis (strain ATCC 50581 / GS clone H7) TaxID=598745 RepID=C6LYQ3_GIAIB|nr:Helicase-related protein [Giardia intestinalis ATCC 50581]